MRLLGRGSSPGCGVSDGIGDSELRLPAQLPPGPADVGCVSDHIAGPRRASQVADPMADDLLEDGDELMDGVRAAGPDVDDRTVARVGTHDGIDISDGGDVGPGQTSQTWT